MVTAQQLELQDPGTREQPATVVTGSLEELVDSVPNTEREIMRLPIIAYTVPTQAAEVRWATGVEPLLSPPAQWHSPALFNHLDPARHKPHVIYLSLHGYQHQPYLYGAGTTALMPDSLRDLTFPGSVIFAPCCHLASSPMLGHLLETQPAAVIAGEGPNWSPFVHVLGKTFVRLLRLRLPPRTALKLARVRLAAHSDHAGALDALGLRLYTPQE